MSKTQLKKELTKMNAEQIAELVLDLYSARPEAKEYLEFYISPDIDKKLEKAKAAIDKELLRNSRRGYPRPRITKIRRYIRDIESLNPGAEHVIEISMYALRRAAETGSENWLKDATQRGAAKLLADTVKLGDKAGLLDMVLTPSREYIAAMRTDAHYSRQFKHLLSETLDEAIEGVIQ